MLRRALALLGLIVLTASFTGCNGGGLCGCFRQEEECCDPCGGAYGGYETGHVSGFGGDEFGGVMMVP